MVLKLSIGLSTELLKSVVWWFPSVSWLSHRVAHNVLQLGEVADLEALTFNLAVNFI